MKMGGMSTPRKARTCSSLRVLGTVGEARSTPEAWDVVPQPDRRRKVARVGGQPTGRPRTGGHVITPLPGAIATKPGSCTLPMLGIDAASG